MKKRTIFWINLIFLIAFMAYVSATLWATSSLSDFNSGVYTNTSGNSTGVFLNQTEYYTYDGFNSDAGKVIYLRMNNNPAIGEASSNISVDESGSGNNGTLVGSINNYPYGITNNGTYFWTTDTTDAEVYQYWMNGTYTGTHWDTAASGNGDPRGIMQNGTYFWIGDVADKRVYLYWMNGTYASSYIDTSVSGTAYVPFIQYK